MDFLFSQMCPMELPLNQSKYRSSLVGLVLVNGIVSSKMSDKRDDFNSTLKLFFLAPLIYTVFKFRRSFVL